MVRVHVHLHAIEPRGAGKHGSPALLPRESRNSRIVKDDRAELRMQPIRADDEVVTSVFAIGRAHEHSGSVLAHGCDG